MRAIRAQRGFLVKLGLVLALLAVIIEQPACSFATTPQPTTKPGSKPAAWFTTLDFIFPLLCWPIACYFYKESNRHSNRRGSNCNDCCDGVCDTCVNFALGTFFLVIPLAYLFLKGLAWFLCFVVFPGIQAILPGSPAWSGSMDRMHKAGVIEAIYCFLVLIILALFLLCFVETVLRRVGNLPPEVVERKRVAVFVAFDHWVSIYIVGWTAVAIFDILDHFLGFLDNAIVLMRLRMAFTPLVIAVMIPQVVLTTLLELGPFELAGHLSNMQTHVLLCSLAGLLLAAVHVCLGEDDQVTIVFIGAFMGALVAGIFFICRHAFRSLVNSLRGQLSLAELERQRSLLQHPAQRLCTICGGSEAGAYNSPCGHSFLCMPCAKQFQEHEGTVCNVCRQPSSLVPIGDVEEPAVALPLRFRSLERTTSSPSLRQPMELVAGLWRTRMARLQERRAAQKRVCSLCGPTTGNLRNAINLECGHSQQCMSCAHKWREQHGEKCPQCRGASTLKEIITVQRCDICFSEAAADNLFAIGACAHQICVPCSMRYVRTALGSVADEVKPQGVRCPIHSSGCSEFLTVSTVRQFLVGRQSTDEPDMEPISEQEVDRFQRFVLEAAIPKERRFYCVNHECGRLMSIDLPELLRSAQPRLECTFCNTAQCARCKILWHSALTCQEVEEQKRSADQGNRCRDDMFLIEATTKPCPNCSFRISHYHGHACHHIRPGTGCLNCGHHFCYSCLRAGRSCSRCRLYCQNEGILENLIMTPWPHDRRCGCPICPDCRPGRKCPQCDGSCVVCRGIVAPGVLTRNAPLVQEDATTQRGTQRGSLYDQVHSWLQRTLFREQAPVVRW